MATLPGLILKIGANTKDAIDGLNKVNRAVGSSASGADRMRASWRKAGPAIAAAGAAAGVLAIKLGVDAVQAAMEDEKSVAKLSQTLQNLGMAASDAGIEKLIDDLQFATGVADDKLRPAMQLLVGSFKDVGKAQDMLRLALDLSAAGFGDVEGAAAALGKAAGGNLGALQRLTRGGLDPATVKAKDFNGALDQLSTLVGGQAARNAETLQGKMARLGIAFGELQESFGNGLIRGLVGADPNSTKALDDAITKLREMQPTVERVGAAIMGFAQLALSAFEIVRGTVVEVVYSFTKAVNELYDTYIEVADKLGIISDAEADRERTTQKAIEAAQKQAYYEDLLGYQFGQGAAAAAGAEAANVRLTTAAEDATRANEGQIASIKRLQGVLDTYGKKQSIMQERFGLKQLIAQGPAKSGQRTTADGKIIQFSTAGDRKEQAFAISSQSRQLANDLLGEGKRKAARNALEEGRAAIRNLGLSNGFEKDLLALLRTPSGLRPGQGTAPGTPQTGQQVANVNYNFYGGINVQDGNAAAQAAKEAKRLAALSGDRYAGMAATGKGYRR